MEQEIYNVENRWRNKYMNLGRELGEIINSQQDRILSLSQEKQQTQKGELEPKKVERQETAPKSLVTVLTNLVAQLH